MKKRVLAMLLASGMIIGVLSGCGGGSTTESTAPAESQAAETQESEAPEAEPVTFSVATSYAEGSDYITTLQAACDTITEKTNGVVNFVIYPSNQLGSVADAMESMLNGSNVMAGFGMGNLAGYVKEGAVASYPYVVNNYDELRNLFNSDWWDGIKTQLINDWNMVPIMCFSVGYRNMIGTVPIRCADDFKPVITRIGMGTVGQDFITACGGTPTTTSSFSDCYSAIQTKMFDLCEADCELLYNSALYEVADYLSITHHMMNPCIFAVHKDLWDKIPAEYQEITLEELDKAGQQIWDTYSGKENEWIEKFKEQGVTVITNDEIDVESFRAVVPTIMERQGVSPEGYDAVIQAAAGK